jgi:SAM-dependent MidA family methyltransferase
VTPLESTIRAEIAARGPLTFARFMEIALYHPRWGYYTAPGAPARIGRAGDYFTNVSVGAMFGAVLATQFAEMWETMGRPAEFLVLELGAHRGQLGADVCAWVKRQRPDFAATLRYETRDYPGDVPMRFTGCIVSNELVDSFPVHRVTRRGDEWLELHVAVRDEQLTTVAAGLSCDELRDAVARLPRCGTEDYTTEIHLEAGRWMARVARCIERGFVMTVDYGYAAEDYYAPHRKEGTLLCYRQHRLANDPLARPGEQDITAHVNFSALVECGAAGGLAVLGFTEQCRFVAGALERHGQSLAAADDPGAIRQLKTLLHPELMGQTFKVLVQHRRMEGAKLSGLKFGPDGAF